MIFRSDTSRLVLSYCLLLALLGGVFLAICVLSFKYYARESLTNTLSARAQDIWNVTEVAVNQPDQLKQIIQRRFSPESQNRYIRIRVGDDVKYQSGSPASGAFDAKNVPLPIMSKDARRSELYGNLLLHTREFKDQSGRLVSVDSGQSFVFARTIQGRLTYSLFIGLPILLLLAAVAGYVLMRQALKPVEAMIQAAEMYSFNDPHKRLPLVGNEPRIEALGLALNRMLDRLDKAYSHANRFSADAAHELRTPLTIIRGELELVAASKDIAPHVDRAIANSLEEIARLSAVVNDLITLSRMESMWGKHLHAPVNLNALAGETIEQMHMLAVEKKIELAGPLGPDVTVAGDRSRLKQVLVNLLDNAIKHTPAGGRVVAKVGIKDAMGFLAIEDNGVGIDPAHHDKVFERFYRVSTDRGDTGAGLGLAIVKSICNAHGGSVVLRSVPNIGSLFRIEIPLMSGRSETVAAREMSNGLSCASR